MTAELKSAGVVGAQATATSEEKFGVESITLSRIADSPEIVTVKAGVYVPCGVDTSVYVYRFSENGRVRLLEADGTREWGDTGMDLQFSSRDPSGARVLYLSWFGVSCASVWNTLDYRLFRISPGDNHADPIFSGAHTFTIDDDYHAKVTTEDFLLELTAGALSPGWRRTYVLHYTVGAHGARRIDPVALQPQDFVHEWINEPWPEMASRSATGLENWHKFLHDFSGEYDFVQPCSGRKGFTQVAIEPSVVGKKKPMYFLVKDNGDHSYRMSGVSYVRQTGCPGQAQPIDFTIQPSLFEKK